MKDTKEIIRERYSEHYGYKLDALIFEDLIKRLGFDEVDLHKLIGDLYIILNAKRGISEWSDEDEKLFHSIGGRLEDKSILSFSRDDGLDG